ncbi:MAG: 5-formyltetrahydrofolate cyclo-ligase [Candidatus Omnitrophica bacterium]|nr:5-formyltetrahydrofolate cyclo-ligase [Candidatus Omnitrophota bacterium]
MLTKEKIRSIMLLRLKKQKEEIRKQRSRLIKRKLFRTKEFIKAKTIMFYISFGGEVETAEMIKQAFRLGKTVVVPVCEKRTIRPCILEKNSSFKKGRYGIYEPVKKEFIEPEKIELVLVPGLAFDKHGNRLGRGKGYYDRFLKKLSANTVSIGLAYNFQILNRLPATPLDVKVQKIIFA